MKNLSSVLLICMLCFSMIGCSSNLIDTLDGINSFLDELNSTLDAMIESAGYDTTVEESDKPYKIPIILLHGRDSNTEAFFGVRTSIDSDTNSYYGTDFEEMYANPGSHKILFIEEGRLGEYLVEQLGYEPNKNLFAFNYPNVDMVEMNAKRLAQYINNLVDAGEKGLNGTENFVDPDYLFASEEDRANKQVKFILIGHSMGGLVSRYYIENLGTEHVEKLITICTPHYGSGLGLASDLTNLPFKPCDLDLRPDSQLFGGEKLTDYDIVYIKGTKEEYAYLHQSRPLKGNHPADVQYYAIGGYDINLGGYDINLGDYDTGTDEKESALNPELPHLPEKMKEDLLQGRTFSVSFKVKAENWNAFQQQIWNQINQLTVANYGKTSNFVFSNIGGDNVVDYMSQFAVRFDLSGQTTGYQKIEHATLILTTGYNMVSNRYHSAIATEPLMHEAVSRYIAAVPEPEVDPAPLTTVGFDSEHWTLVDAQYDESQDCVILTEDKKTWQTGSVWYNTPVSRDFVLEMDYYTGRVHGSYGGADGIVVAFYADATRERKSGLDIGFSGCAGYGIELDTYYNSERNDPHKYNHIALVKGTVGNHLASNLLPESEDEQWHHLKVEVKDGVCNAYVDGVLKISVSVDKTGHQWLGITSATGSGYNLHAVKNISLTHN